MTQVTTVIFTINQRKFEAHLGKQEKRTRGRAYVHGWFDDIGYDLQHSVCRGLGIDTVYTQRDAHPLMDKAWDAFNSVIVAAKKQVLDEALDALKIEPAARSSKFSRKAGCSCGCSPGFILEELHGYDLWVDELKDSRKEGVAVEAVAADFGM